MKDTINKYRFLLYILYLFKDESIGSKIYIIARIILIPGAVFEILKKNIFQENVIDFGCGYGILSLYFYYIKQNNKILGLDKDKIRIKTLQNILHRKQITNMTFETKDFIQEEINDYKGYETGILIDILHHLDEKTQIALLEKISKTLSKIIIKDIDTTPKYKYYRNYFHDKILMQNSILHFQGSKKIKKQLESLGYHVQYKKIHSIFPYPHFLLLAEK